MNKEKEKFITKAVNMTNLPEGQKKAIIEDYQKLSIEEFEKRYSKVDVGSKS